jgi:hypothetical protein
MAVVARSTAWGQQRDTVSWLGCDIAEGEVEGMGIGIEVVEGHGVTWLESTASA